MPRSLAVSATLVLALALALGCRRKADREAARDKSEPTTKLDSVSVKVDGVEVTNLTVTQPTPITSLIGGKPLPTDWRFLRAEGRLGHKLHIKEPEKTYPHLEAKLFVGKDGRPSIGLFRTGADDPEIQIVEVASVNVETAVAPAPSHSAALKVVFADGTTKEIKRGELEALREDRVKKKRKLRGWLLPDAIALATDKPFKTVRLTAGETSAEISATELGDKNFRATLRFNKRGLLRFGAWKLGEAEPVSVHQLTGVTQIEIL